MLTKTTLINRVRESIEDIRSLKEQAQQILDSEVLSEPSEYNLQEAFQELCHAKNSLDCSLESLKLIYEADKYLPRD